LISAAEQFAVMQGFPAVDQIWSDACLAVAGFEREIRDMTPQTRSVGYAILKLRSSITACCTAVGLCLIVQVIVWSLVAFTNMRTVTVEPEIDAPLVVDQSEATKPRAMLTTNTAVSFKDVAEPVTVLTRSDQFFHDAASLAQTIGTAACMVLVILMLIGVIISSSQFGARVHLVVSAMIWTALLAVLALPLGGLFELPWEGGALRPYRDIVGQVEAWQAGTQSTMMLWTRSVILPVICGLGCVLIMWRFGRGVEPLLPEEMHRLDPELEKETSNISVTSLHGGRSGAALNRMIDSQKKAADAAAQADTLPRANQVSVGDSPKRII